LLRFDDPGDRAIKLGAVNRAESSSLLLGNELI
jgi:hypothetical protein